jgi:phosphopantothenoylcysteine synthetase/decarboxylase
MWENPVTKANCEKLQGLGYRFIGPEAGWLACRNVGMGRMSEAKIIVEQLLLMLAEFARTLPQQ